MKKYIVQTCLQSKAKLKVHYETNAVIFSSLSLFFFFFSDSKTIYIDILYSIYILINTMPDNPVLYLFSDQSCEILLPSSLCSRKERLNDSQAYFLATFLFNLFLSPVPLPDICFCHIHYFPPNNCFC